MYEARDRAFEDFLKELGVTKTPNSNLISNTQEAFNAGWVARKAKDYADDVHLNEFTNGFTKIVAKMD